MFSFSGFASFQLVVGGYLHFSKLFFIFIHSPPPLLLLLLLRVETSVIVSNLSLVNCQKLLQPLTANWRTFQDLYRKSQPISSVDLTIVAASVINHTTRFKLPIN